MISNTTNLGASSPLPEGGKSFRIPIGALHAFLTAAVFLAALVGCASTSVQLSGDRPADGVCRRSGENVSGLVIWRTQWRADQKDIPEREAAAERGLSEYLASSGCLSSYQMARRQAAAMLTLQGAREAVQSANPSATRVLVITVRELGPVIQVLSSAALVEGGTEVVLGVQSFELSAPNRSHDFVVHWKNGGPGVIKGVATLSNDMQAALAVGLGAGKQ